jgi:hypothetical protein
MIALSAGGRMSAWKVESVGAVNRQLETECSQSSVELTNLNVKAYLDQTDISYLLDQLH